jgi:hypothetical protein
MQPELLWALFLLAGLAAVTVFFWVRRLRHRAHWRSKRPIHVRVQPDGPNRSDAPARPQE